MGESRQGVKVFYVWGVAGAGKSHLLAAFHAAALAAVPTQAESRHVVIDDVETLDDAQQVALFNAINQRSLEPSAVVIAAGNVAPRDLSLRPELSSRLGSGLVFCLQPLTDREKMSALRAHAASRGFSLREEVVVYLLRHSRRDMPSLIGMLDALDQCSLETGREISLPMLKQLEQPEFDLGDSR